MKSVSPGAIISAVREEIDYDLSLQDALARDYANMSAVSRMIKPRIEEKLGKDVNLESVITSLKRLRGTYTAASGEIRTVIAESVVNVRTNVSKISVEKTRRTLEAVSVMLSAHQHDFLHVSESISSITLIFDQKLHKRIKAKLDSLYDLIGSSDTRGEMDRFRDKAEELGIRFADLLRRLSKEPLSLTATKRVEDVIHYIRATHVTIDAILETVPKLEETCCRLCDVDGELAQLQNCLDCEPGDDE